MEKEKINLIELLSFVQDIVVKVIIKNLIFTILTSFISILPIYYLFPEVIKWVLFKLEFSDIKVLDIIEESNSKDLIISSLKEERTTLLEQIKKLEVDNTRSKVQYEGVTQIMDDYKVERINYVNLFIAIVVLFGVSYFAFMYVDPSSFKSLNTALLELTNLIISSNSDTSKIVSETVIKSSISIEHKIQVLQNAINIINVQLEELVKKRS